MISIKKAKQIREELGLTHLVIFGITPDNVQHVATHGDSKLNANEAANAGNKLKKSLDWPLDLCNSKPVERICNNCDFFQSGYRPGDQLVENKAGKCLFEPEKVIRSEKDRACHHFEP